MSDWALLAEPSLPISAALRKYLEAAGLSVKVAYRADEALALAKKNAPALAFATVGNHLDGEGLCRSLKQAHPSCQVVLVYPPDVEEAETHGAKAGADATLVGPLKRGTVVSCAKTLIRMKGLRDTVERLEADLKKHIADPPKDLEHIEGTSADFDFFRKYLLMELKRSRRYKYPVSFLIVVLDHFTERAAGLDVAAQKATLTEALTVITRSVRDIDLAIPSVAQRFLVFLPHTPREGAALVATRIQERLGKLKQLGSATASVGVASYEPGAQIPPVSFGTLMKSATDALKRAQAAGGNRIEADRTPKRKKERISLA